MADGIRTIKISKDTLEAFAVYDIDWYDLTLLPLADCANVIIKCDDPLKFTLDHMAEVLEQVISRKVDAPAFFFEWFEPFVTNFYEALELDSLFGDNPLAIDAYHMSFMPQTDDEILKWIIARLYQLFKDLSPAVINGDAAQHINAHELLSLIDWHSEEMALPVEDRHYPDILKADFIRDLDNDLILRDADGFTKKLFRTYVNDLSEKNNFDALRIKGYAMCGGNSVFESNYKEAARCMEILWRDGGFGYAANTLGFMYFDGHLSGGKPDFENAFKYFCIGNSFDITESTYKLSEMFMNGLYVTRNLSAAGAFAERVYNDARNRFESGEFEGNFTEAALRMGEIQLATTNPHPLFESFSKRHAYGFFLQAEYAIKLREHFAPSRRDKELTERINTFIESLDGYYKAYKRTYHSKDPGPLPDFINYRHGSKCLLKFKALKSGKIKITLKHMPDPNTGIAPMTLLTLPEFKCCTLTDTISITAENAALRLESLDELITDGVDISESITQQCKIKFLSGDRTLAVLTADSFLQTHPGNPW